MRIHLAQIFYKPAYFDAGVDYLAEPSGEVSSKPLASLKEVPEVEAALLDLKTSYIRHVREKLAAIVAWSASRGADVLALPEYSVPTECLRDVHSAATSHDLCVVAGSHRVRPSTESQQIYLDVGARALPETGSAVCPVILPGAGCVLASKLCRSKWEGSLNVPTASVPTKFRLQSGATGVNCGVLLCIDSLDLEVAGRMFERERPSILFCPSLSPTTEPFAAVGQLSALSEVLFCYVNDAQMGGTFFNIPSGWRTIIEGGTLANFSMPRGVEGVLELDVDPATFFEKKGVLSGGAGVKPPVSFQVVYSRESPAKTELIKLREDLTTWIQHTDIPTALDWLDSFIVDHGPRMPELLLRNLRDLRYRHLPMYDGNLQRVVDATEVIEVSSLQGTRTHFSVVTQQAIGLLADQLKNSNYDRFSELMLGCLGDLKRRQRALPPLPATGLALDSPDKASPIPEFPRPRSTGFDISHFQNRGSELDQLRDFFADPDTRLVAITGPLGIGKADLVRAAFAKQFTDWDMTWIQIAAETRVPRLIAEIGYPLGVPLDIDALSTASHEVFRGKVRKVVEAIYDRERHAFIISDLDSILRRANVRDLRQLSTLFDEASAPREFVGSKVFILSSQWLKREWISRKGVKHLHLPRLKDLYVRRILEFSTRRAGTIKQESVPEPPQKLLDLIDGHPLSAKLAVEFATDQGLAKLGDDAEIAAAAGHIATVLLKHAALTSEDDTALRRLSVFRIPVSEGLAAKVTLLDSILVAWRKLSERSVVDYDGEFFRMHEAIRRYYYDRIAPSERSELHRAAAGYFNRAYSDQQNVESSGRDPSIVCELIHHLVMSGQKADALGLRDLVLTELKETARTIYRRWRDYDRALELYRFMAEIAPNDVSVRAYVGRCYARLRMWAESDKEFQQAIVVASKTGERVAWVYRDWGHIRSRFQFYPEAIDHLSAALKADRDAPPDPSIHAALAYVYWKMGEFDLAAEQFEEALRANAGHGYTLTYYPRFLEQRGNHEYAAELRRRRARVDADQPYASRTEEEDELEYEDE